MKEVKITFGESYCCCLEFSIGGIEADDADFGVGMDIDRENAEEYCCGNRQFFIRDSSKEVLEKYGITEEEYLDIAERLKKGLSWGRCGWCS